MKKNDILQWFCIILLILPSCEEKESKQLPKSPDTPILSVDTFTQANDYVLRLCFNADGADKYILRLNNMSHLIEQFDTIYSGEEQCVDYVCPQSDGQMITLTAVNNYGQSVTREYVYNASAADKWKLFAIQQGDNLYVIARYGITDVDYPIVKTEVCALNGQVLITNNSSSQYTDISSLPRAIYLAKVTLQNGIIISHIFPKR